MKRRIALIALCVALALSLSMAFACAADKVNFTVDGKQISASETLELGDLYVVPDVSAERKGEKLEVEVKAFDSAGEAVKLVNGKFKVTDLGGYRIEFSAGGETFTLTLVVRDTKAPVFSVKGTEGSVVLFGTEVEIPECTVSDESGSDLEVVVTVKDADGETVTVTDGKFTANKLGRYTVTYSATDASGNEGKKDFTLLCKNAVMLNAFESEDDLGTVVGLNATKEVVSENTMNGNGIKITMPDKIDNPDLAWIRICVPIKTADGGYMSWEDLKEFESVQIYIYSSVANEFGLSLRVDPIEVGKNVLMFNMSEIEAFRKTASTQYSEDENGFYFNLRYPTPGSYYILDSFIGIYADDYVAPIRIKGEDGKTLPEKTNADYGTEYEFPAAIATRDGRNIELTVKAYDSQNNEVTVENGRINVTDLNGYKIVYSAEDGGVRAEETVIVEVNDTRIPIITVNERNGALVMKGEKITVPSSSVRIITGEELTASVKITGPDGNEVVVTDGAFVASEVGEYKLVYTALSATGNSGEEEITLVCKDGVRLNAFEDVSDFTWSHGSPNVTVTEENAQSGKGVKVEFAGSGSWGRICLPLKNKDGSYISYEDLLEFEYVELYVWLSSDNRLGTTIEVESYSAGRNTVRITRQQIIDGYAADSAQYSSDANGFYLNIGDYSSSTVIVLDDFIGYYPENYIERAKWSLAGYENIPENISAEDNKEFTVPAMTASRGGSAIEVTLKVYDSVNDDVSLTDGKFVPSDLNGYTLVWSVDGGRAEEVRVTLNVIDTAVPSITVNEHDGAVIIKGEATAIPAAEGTFKENTLQVGVSVTDPDGESVTLGENAFTPKKTGTYTLVFTATADNGKKAEKTITLKCKDVVRLNAFESAADVGWVSCGGTKNVVYENAQTGNGLLLTCENAVNWSRICVPLKMNGTFITYEQLLQFDYVELYLYLEAANEIGLTHEVYPVTAGANVLRFTKAQIQAGYSADANQYSANENGFYINVKTVTAGMKIIFDDFVGHYPEGKPSDGSVILNSFNSASSVGWTPFSKELTVVDADATHRAGLKMAIGSEAAWARICIPCTDETGAFLTWEQVNSYEKIVLNVYSSYATRLVLISGDCGIDLVAGENAFTFTKEQLAALYAANPDQYAPNENGLYFTIQAAVPGEYLIFESLKGYNE